MVKLYIKSVPQPHKIADVLLKHIISGDCNVLEHGARR